MKKIVIMSMAACLISASIPMFSAAVDHQEEYSCKVEARKCTTDLSVAQAKMKKMNENIKKGTKYSEEDMKKLQKSISDLQQAIDNMKPMK